jgi:hypothetical protein
VTGVAATDLSSKLQSVPLGAHLTTASLRRLGVSRRELRGSVSAGLLQQVCRGLYVRPAAAGEERWLTNVRVAVARAGEGAVAARFTAARLHAMIGSPAVMPIEVLIPVQRSKPLLAGVAITRSDVPAVDRLARHGLQVTSPLRTAIDCARFGDRVAATSITESALRQGLFTDADLQARVARSRRAPGVKAALAVIALVDVRSESPLETALRVALLDAGFPGPELQFPFAHGAIRGRIDIAYPAELLGRTSAGRYVGLAIEADGRASHQQDATFHHDRVRHTALEEAGWLVRRFTDRAVRLRTTEIVATVGRAMETVRTG